MLRQFLYYPFSSSSCDSMAIRSQNAHKQLYTYSSGAWRMPWGPPCAYSPDRRSRLHTWDRMISCPSVWPRPKCDPPKCAPPNVTPPHTKGAASPSRRERLSVAVARTLHPMGPANASRKVCRSGWGKFGCKWWRVPSGESAFRTATCAHAEAPEHRRAGSRGFTRVHAGSRGCRCTPYERGGYRKSVDRLVILYTGIDDL